MFLYKCIYSTIIFINQYKHTERRKDGIDIAKFHKYCVPQNYVDELVKIEKAYNEAQRGFNTEINKKIILH